MKKTRLKKIGRYGRINIRANKKIKEMFLKKGIDRCEACPVLHKLGHLNWQCLQASSNAHRHSRIEYRKNLNKLYDYKQVIRACIPSHKFMDENKEVREQVFLVLRGEETNDTKTKDT